MSDTPETKPTVAPWPSTITTREDLDQSLEDGESSGPSSLSISEIVKRVKARLKRG